MDLYEEAIKHRWKPATDLGLGGRPVGTARGAGAGGRADLHGLQQQRLVEQKIIGKWLEQISYGYHEPKLFLATQAFDAGRKVEALRKRALINGGGLGQAPLGQVYRAWYQALTFTDMLIALDVIYKSYEVTLFESASEWVQTPLEADMFERLARDSRRHLDYGLGHLEWYARYKPSAERTLPISFFRSEAGLISRDAALDRGA